MDKDVEQIANEIIEEAQKEKRLEELCMLVSPIKLENEVGMLLKPCGIKYKKGVGVYCAKYADKTCNYIGEKK